VSEIAYTVTASFTDAAVAEKWLRWLGEGHVADVLAGGAERAEIVRLDGPGSECEVRYRFPSREAFDRYLERHAPRLRAEGVARFPPERGVSYRRSVGEVVAVFP
jgi:Domain of unknown function (DUF4286)